MKRVAFGALALGSRFCYTAGGQVFVKITAYTVAEWDPALETATWSGQGIYQFNETNDRTQEVFLDAAAEGELDDDDSAVLIRSLL